jgi:hypothetical protein
MGNLATEIFFGASITRGLRVPTREAAEGAFCRPYVLLSAGYDQQKRFVQAMKTLSRRMPSSQDALGQDECYFQVVSGSAGKAALDVRCCMPTERADHKAIFQDMFARLHSGHGIEKLVGFVISASSRPYPYSAVGFVFLSALL